MRLAPTMRISSGNSPCRWASSTFLLRPRSRPCWHGCRTGMNTCGGWRCTPWDASPPRMRNHSAGEPGQAGVNISASWRCGRSKPSSLPGCDTTFLQPRRRVESSWETMLSTLSKERQAANAGIAAFRFPLSAFRLPIAARKRWPSLAAVGQERCRLLVQSHYRRTPSAARQRLNNRQQGLLWAACCARMVLASSSKGNL